MDVGVSYKQKPIVGRYDVIVVGSGMGGLTVAATLAKRSRKRVLVLEQHYTAGGFTHSFKRPGYEWDVGVHYIGQVGELGALRGAFDYLSEGRLDWASLPEVYDRVYLGDRSYDLVAGTKHFLRTMKEAFPGEERAIDRYLDSIRASVRSGQVYFAEKILPRPLSGVVGPFLRAPHLRWARRTTADVVGSLTRNKTLAAVLTAQFGDYGLPPRQSSFAVHAAVVAHFLGGAFFPIGGAAAIARSIAPTIERAGGAIYVNADVDKVLVEGGRASGVRMADGREVRAPIVISDAGVANTFGRLVPRELAGAPANALLSRVTPSVGHLCLYLGFKHTDEELGLTGTNLWIYPDENHDENIARFLADQGAPLPLVYVSFPSAKDPTFRDRHPGRATVDVITLARYDWFARWSGTRWHKRGADYDALKARFTERLLDVVFTKLPQLRGKVDVAELSTPLTTRHFAGHPHGELYGLDHTPERYRISLRPKSPVRGLFLCGQDVASCGVGGALIGGLLAAAAIDGPRVFADVMRGAT